MLLRAEGDTGYAVCRHAGFQRKSSSVDTMPEATAEGLPMNVGSGQGI